MPFESQFVSTMPMVGTQSCDASCSSRVWLQGSKVASSVDTYVDQACMHARVSENYKVATKCNVRVLQRILRMPSMYNSSG